MFLHDDDCMKYRIFYTVDDTNISCKEGNALYEKILCIYEYFFELILYKITG